MSLIDLLVVLIIAFVCGSIAQALAGGSRGGCLVTIALGFIGAIVGTWIAQTIGLPEFVKIGGIPVVWSIIGGALFSAVLSWLTRRMK
jgi:uncharacterized membrane protein YeaQ/YmgE (transglycosylase-associated protein family)